MMISPTTIDALGFIAEMLNWRLSTMILKKSSIFCRHGVL